MNLTMPLVCSGCKDVSRVKKLERELKSKDKALLEARAMLALSRRAQGLVLGGRGRFHPPQVRRQVCALIGEAVAQGARLTAACRLLGLSTRSFLRWRKPGGTRDGRVEPRRSPANRLDEHERRQVLELIHSPAFRGLSPREIVPRLADQGLYLASESTMYRLLRAERRELWRRGSPSRVQPMEERIASAPNQIWSWDITCLKGPVPGRFLYLYLVMDVFSRRIMGWRIHSQESTERASALIRQVCRHNRVKPSGLVLHSDNGRPMRGAAMLTTLRRLGIRSSFSRPAVSNDNAFVESLFHTLKGRPGFPERHFASLRAARAWVARFTAWYNQEHLHGGLGYVTPDDRYSGRDAAVLERRAHLYAWARSARSGRWPRRARGWARAEPPRVKVRAGCLSEDTAPALLPGRRADLGTTGLTRSEVTPAAACAPPCP